MTLSAAHQNKDQAHPTHKTMWATKMIQQQQQLQQQQQQNHRLRTDSTDATGGDEGLKLIVFAICSP